MMEDRQKTDRNLSLDDKGPCECCGDEDHLAGAFLNDSSRVTCSRCSQRWRGWSGGCDWAGSTTKDMSNEECEDLWAEFVSETIEWIAKVDSSDAKRDKGSCVACPATAETTPMRSLPEDFFPDRGWGRRQRRHMLPVPHAVLGQQNQEDLHLESSSELYRHSHGHPRTVKTGCHGTLCQKPLRVLHARG